MSKIQGLLKAYSTVFKDKNLMKNTDLSVKILLSRVQLPPKAISSHGGHPQFKIDHFPILAAILLIIAKVGKCQIEIRPVRIISEKQLSFLATNVAL